MKMVFLFMLLYYPNYLLKALLLRLFQMDYIIIIIKALTFLFQFFLLFLFISSLMDQEYLSMFYFILLNFNYTIMVLYLFVIHMIFTNSFMKQY